MYSSLTTENVMLTPEGGIAVRMFNNTGSSSVKGSVVKPDFTHDDSFSLSGEDSAISIGVVYEDGVPQGAPCFVVVSGKAHVLMKDGEPSVRGYWVSTSDVEGRANAGGEGHPGTNPPAQAEHNKEIGHCIESVAAGADKLSLCVLHFN